MCGARLVDSSHGSPGSVWVLQDAAAYLERWSALHAEGVTALNLLEGAVTLTDARPSDFDAA